MAIVPLSRPEPGGGMRPGPGGDVQPAPDDLEALLGERLLRTFTGLVPTTGILAAIAAGRASGVSLYRAKNIESPAQILALTEALQAARPAGAPPILVAIDQEGGQLQAVGDGATAWPGNLALAATRSVDLARRTGAAIGLELAAMGVNVNFAPVCDLLDDPRSPLMGTRTFGDDPVLAGTLAAAMAEGLQSAGVAATLKHFPGHGSVVGDSHHGLPVSRVDATTLRTRELVPFRAGIAAGARLMMLGHLAVPTATDGRVVPATLAPELARDLLRDELGFEGVSVTDALDMGALYATVSPDGVMPDLPAIAVEAAAAGLDLLLTLHDHAVEEQALDALIEAARSGRLDAASVAEAARRIRALRRWTTRTDRPPLSVVGSTAHADLAREIAERAVTLIHDRQNALPLVPEAGDRVVAVSPRPVDLTPADTSSYLRFGLAEALRDAGLPVTEVVAPLDPTPAEIATLVAGIVQPDGADLAGADLAGADSAGGRVTRTVVVVGTIDALVHTGQARLVEALVASGTTTIAVALRTPVDVLAYPVVATALATYGSQPPNLRALAEGLTGRIPFTGRLPVRYDPGDPA